MKLVGMMTNQNALANESYRDFEDNSDAKTSSCSLYLIKRTYKGMIGSAEHKIGYIRAAIYNEWKDDIDFFLIPPPTSRDNICSYNYQGNICYSWNMLTEKYSNGLENYRKKTLKEVCVNINSIKKAA
jgi:hypothetical protein